MMSYFIARKWDPTAAEKMLRNVSNCLEREFIFFDIIIVYFTFSYFTYMLNKMYMYLSCLRMLRQLRTRPPFPQVRFTIHITQNTDESN